MIIGISGKARAGKDLLASFMVKEGWEKLSFAKSLKNDVKEAFGLTNDHVNGALKEEPCELLNGYSPRQLMIEYGNLFRKYDEDHWVRLAMAETSHNPGVNYVVTDLRYRNEVEIIRNYGGLIVRLDRHYSRDSMVTPETNASPSETALDGYNKWDFHLPAELNETESQLNSFWNVIKAVISSRV